MGDSSKDARGASGWRPSFYGQVHCPWASSAPISATTNFKNAGKCFENCHEPPRNFSEQFQLSANSKTDPWFSRNKPTLTYFNNFVRLMQLFPEMHPASLHTALSMCRNEFISTVDRLLYVRRYRSSAFYRKESSVSNLNKKAHRRIHTCSSMLRNSNTSSSREEVKLAANGQQPIVDSSGMTGDDFDVLLPNRTFEVKRLVYNNKAKIRCSRTDAELLADVDKLQQQQVKITCEDACDLSHIKQTTCS